MSSEWCKTAYEASVSSRCWWYTPYDDGWDKCPGTAEDAALRGIVEMERALGESTPVKRWLVRLFRRKLRFYASYEEGLDRLINPRANAARGSRSLLLQRRA